MKTGSILLVTMVWPLIVDGKVESAILPEFRSLGYDLRTFVVSKRELDQSKRDGLILIDFTYVSPISSHKGVDLGFNKTHYISAPMTVLETIDIMIKRYPDRRLFDLGFVIYIFQKNLIWKFNYLELGPELEKMANSPLEPGDTIIVKLEDG